MKNTVNSDRVEATANRRQRCTICGKWAKRQRTFMNTVSPFNRDVDDKPKSREQVQWDVHEEAVSWRPKPQYFDHITCRPRPEG